MEVTVLVENTSLSDSFQCEHGLSVFVKTELNNVLVDTGQTDIFAHNAEICGVDIGSADYLILSHGHYDHCGGVMTFSEINSKADIFISGEAFGNFYNSESEKYIGVDKRIACLPNLKTVKGRCNAADNIEIFGSVSRKDLYPFGNIKLKSEVDGMFVPDDFSHEQYAVITENDKRVLFSGCAHKGIVNIIREFADIYGEVPYAVVSGFHLMKNTEYSPDEIRLIRDTAAALKQYPVLYYSGHCTGAAFDIMKELLGEKLVALHSGMKFEI